MVVTYFGVESFRRWSHRREIYDIPNERSSHIKPVPRGGGLIIVIVCLSGYLFYTIYLSGEFCWQYFLGAVLIAFISWLDDLYTVSIFRRFLVHTIAALLLVSVLYTTDGFTSQIPEHYKIILLGLVFFWLVWMTNAYNFMDGIDGLAGLQAVVGGIGWLLIGELINARTIGVYGGILAFASTGFLAQNWHPAKVFMGDVGSAFLGYTFAALPVLTVRETNIRFAPIFLAGAGILWLFFFDTVFTFCRRLLSGQKVWKAHRHHIYQRLAINGLTHGTATIIYGSMAAVNAIIVIPLVLKFEYAAILYACSVLETVILLLLVGNLEKNKKNAKPYKNPDHSDSFKDSQLNNRE